MIIRRTSGDPKDPLHRLVVEDEDGGGLISSRRRREMSFVARNHPQQVAANGAREDVDDIERPGLSNSNATKETEK